MDWRGRASRRERNFRGANGFLLEALQIVDGLACEGGGREDRFLVPAKDLEPVGEVLSVIEAWRVRDLKLRAEVSGDQFGALS